jgi:hypothetical protein
LAQNMTGANQSTERKHHCLTLNEIIWQK